ncbi:MAG: universal stress protein [Rubripirellula sp.]|jgi:universal stress protein E
MKRFKNILLYAGMEENEVALARALKLASENQATLTIMDVVKPIPHALGLFTDVASSEELQELVVKDHHEKLQEIADSHKDKGVEISVAVSKGDPATEIVKKVIRDGHDLVVKSVNGQTVGKLFGGIARSLLRICPCPLWLLKPDVDGEFDRILTALDLDATDDAHRNLNQKMMEISTALAEMENAELHIVTAWEVWMEQALRRRAGDAEVDAALADKQAKVEASLNEILGKLESTTPAQHKHIHQGNSATVIRSVANDVSADLLVMGTLCRTGAAGLLIGNTAETVLSGVNCSLLALKPDGFVSPVQID